MNIQLLTMGPGEVERLLKDSSAIRFRDLDITTGAIPPEIVLAAAMGRHRAAEIWFWCAPRLFVLSTENRIVGSAGFKNSPRNGSVEIGCGVAESYRGRNIATEGVDLMASAGFSKPEVTAITAETAVWNIASQRVLEKAFFSRDGSRVDHEDGELITWHRTRTAE